MHVTNGDVGHFQIPGTISKNSRGDVIYNLEYTWNDVMDPFPEAYTSDAQKAEVAKMIPGANPQDFEFHVSWSDKTIIRLNLG